MIGRTWLVFSVSFKRNRLFNIRYFSSEIKPVSALHACSGNHVIKCFNLSQKLKSISEIKSNLSRRGSQLDVDKCIPIWSDIIKTEKCLEELEVKQKKNINIFKHFSTQKKKNKADEDKLEITRIEAKELKQKIKHCEELLNKLIQEMMLPTLSIPNDLHKMTESNDKIISSWFRQPAFSFPVKSFVEIGKHNKELELTNCSPTSYYFKNRLSILDLALVEYFSSQFKNRGFVQHYNPDICKDVLIEGCGINLQDKSEVMSIKCFDDSESFRYLCGSGSLPSFVGWFGNRVYTDIKSLPERLVSVGRFYKEFSTSNKLFTCTQTNMVGAFVAFPNQSDFEEMTLNEIIAILTASYIKLGIHFRFVKYCHSELQNFESAAIGIQMFSPFHNDYFEVGRISLCENYISKRVFSVYKIKDDYQLYLSMVYVQVADVSNLIAFILEVKQTSEGLYNIPRCLEPFMFRFPCTYE